MTHDTNITRINTRPLPDMYASVPDWLAQSATPYGDPSLEDPTPTPIIPYIGDLHEAHLKLVREDGCDVLVIDDEPRVDVDVYISGDAYGSWTLSYDNETDEVVIEHCLPTSYNLDGTWSNATMVASWVYEDAAWRMDPEGVVAKLAGKRVARVRAPHLARLGAEAA